MKFVNIRMWLFLFGAIFLIAAYLFQQSQTNQKQLHQQAMKSIELTRINFQQALEGYHQRLDDYLKRWFLSLSDDTRTSPASKLTGLIDQHQRFPILQIRLLEHKDSIYALQRHRDLKVVSLDSSYLFENDYLFTFDQKLWDIPETTYRPETLLKSLKRQENWKYLGDTTYVDGNAYFGITHPISFYDLMKHNLNNKFFDEIYVLDGDGKVLYPQYQKGLVLFKPEDLYADSTDPDGNRLMKIGNKNIRLQINSEDHEVFIAPVAVGEGYLYLAGVKELGQFQKVALRIDYNLLSAFVIALLIIFTSIPIFSMLNMDVGDILSKNKVYILGLSLIVLSLIIGFTLAFMKNQYQNEDHKQVLKNIEKSYQVTISALVGYLDHNNDSRYLTCPGRHIFVYPHAAVQKPIRYGLVRQEMNSSLYASINEYIEFNNNLQITRLNFFDCKTDIFFNQNKFISIAQRDYAQYAHRNKKFISAHYSQSTGELEGVLSQHNTDEVRKAITFKLSDIAPEESRKGRFFIFKPDGKVLYKSQKVTIPVSFLHQAVDDKKWQQISSLVENNEFTESDTKWEIPLYVNGYEYLGVLKKLQLTGLDQPLWMLYLIDQNIGYLKSSLVSFETILFLSPYVILLITLSLLTPIATKKSIYLSAKPFLYSWYAPNKNKRNQFLLLNFTILFQILILLFIYNFIPHNVVTLLLWFSLFAIQTSTIKFSLLHPDKPRAYEMDEKNYLFIMGFLWVITALLLVWMVAIEEFKIWVFLITLSIIFFGGITIIYCLNRMSTDNVPKIDPLEVGEYNYGKLELFHKKFSELWIKVTQSKAPKRIFSISFLLWAILIGFLPGYMIHREIYYQENFIGSVIENSHETNDRGAREISVSSHALIQNYESLRRYTFSQLSEYNDESIIDFINADYNVISQAFISQQNKINFNHQGLFYSLVLVITVLSIFWLIFKLIMYLSKRIFLTEFVFAYSQALVNDSSQKRRIFIVCPDNSKARDWIVENYGLNIRPEMFINLATISSMDVEDVLKNKEIETCMIIENLHVFTSHPDYVPFLAQLMQKFEKCRNVFIISGVTFKEMLYKLEETQTLLFSEVFASFIFYNVPIQHNAAAFKLPYNDNNEYIRLLNREFKYGPNVEQIKIFITQELGLGENRKPKINLDQANFEKCILKIQRYNKAYFTNIWHELSFREKKMVFYLAKEGFVNYANKEILTLLIEKGIIILNEEENGLELFSYSFRNFVTQIISTEMKKSFVRDEKKYGNAGNILTAAISFVFISLAVISYYDPNILNQTSAYVSAVIGLAGTVISAFNSGLSFFTKKAQGGE